MLRLIYYVCGVTGVLLPRVLNELFKGKVLYDFIGFREIFRLEVLKGNY